MEIDVKNLLLQDLQDIKSLIEYKKYGLESIYAQNLARGIVLNLKEHLEQLIS